MNDYRILSLNRIYRGDLVGAEVELTEEEAQIVADDLFTFFEAVAKQIIDILNVFEKQGYDVDVFMEILMEQKEEE